MTCLVLDFGEVVMVRSGMKIWYKREELKKKRG